MAISIPGESVERVASPEVGREMTTINVKLTKSGNLHLKLAQKFAKAGKYDEAREHFASAGQAFAESAGERLIRIDNPDLTKKEVYEEYSTIASVVEKAATAFGLAGDVANSTENWRIAANMHIRMLMEGIGVTHGAEFKVKERKRNAVNAISAARYANDAELVARARSIAKSILTLYRGAIDSVEEQIERSTRQHAETIELERKVTS